MAARAGRIAGDVHEKAGSGGFAAGAGELILTVLILPWRGEDRFACNANRGGVTVAPHRTAPVLKDCHPAPSRISLRSMRADPPPQGAGETIARREAGPYFLAPPRIMISTAAVSSTAMQP